MENAIQLQVIADSLHNRLHNNAVHVPVLPELAVRVLRLSRTPGNATASLIAQLESHPPALRKLLRLSQAGCFGLATGNDLESMIAHLGQQAVADLTLALSLNAELFNAPGYTQTIVEQLRQAVLCGLWSREVALTRRRQMEAAFICGLCKSIGRPVVIEAALECAVRHRMHLSYDDLMVLADQFEFGATQRVLRAWQLPEVVQAVATHWLDYRTAGEAREQTMTTAAGARLAASFGRAGKDVAGRQTLLKDRVFVDLSITEHQLDLLCSKAPRIAAIADLFT